MFKGFVLEYIWVDGYGELRSKTRIIHKTMNVDFHSQDNLNQLCFTSYNQLKEYKEFTPPEWNYDGSSTNQAKLGENTEILLKPVFVCSNPLRNVTNYSSRLVLCETLDIHRNPIHDNTRYVANEIFGRSPEKMPWFGLEQEYYMFKNEWSLSNDTPGMYYCGIYNNGIQRKIVEEHLEACLQAGLTISGLNAEVSPQQWEFQVGPCVGINAGDHMYIARYLLQKIAEKYDVTISYHPKIYAHLSGSGCHVNFSTSDTRNMEHGEGLKTIYQYIQRLDAKHTEHISVYGKNNDKRLTGEHETAHIGDFSYGVGTRNTSVRIPNQCNDEGGGYLEDRRPAANIDPYIVTSKIFETCCLSVDV
jgi:glutamine synthetase